MQKIRIGICIMACLLGLAGCSRNREEARGNDLRQEEGNGMSEAGSEENLGAGEQNGKSGESGQLRVLSMDDNSYCSNENGFYYLTQDTTELKDGSYGYHMMYMDFATRQEVYLCNNTGCNHDTPDCTSVFSYDEVGYDSIPFLYGESLYLLSKPYDNDGTVSVDMLGGSGEGDGASVLDSTPTVLYRMNPDGTGRTRVYEFGADITVEEAVLGDDTGLYFITKELASEQSGNSTYVKSSKRKLVRVDTESWKESVVCNFDFTQDEKEDDWRLLGVYDSCLVLMNTRYDSEATWEELQNDDVWRERYENSMNQFGRYDLEDGSFEVVYTASNKNLNAYKQRGSVLYVSEDGAGKIRRLDLRTGEESEFVELDCSYIWGGYEDVLCSKTWDDADDHTFYFIDYDSGEIFHCDLVNKSTGWSLEIKAEAKDYFLVVYDYDAIDNGDGSYEILQNKYALIAKEDLYQGRENYLPIQMVGKGM